MSLYSYGTLWLTLSVLFFLFNYILEFISVVTLGGLVAGSFLMGTWGLWLQLLLQKIEAALLGYGAKVREKDPKAPGFSQRSRYVTKFFFLYIMYLLGVYALVKILPGYEIAKMNIMGPMLCVYSALHLEARRVLEGLDNGN